MSQPHRRGLRAAALAAILSGALLFTACSAPSDDGGQSSEAPVANAPDLALAAFSGPNSLDTAQLVDGQQMFVWASIYDTLLLRNAETGEVEGNAAKSWEYNEDGTLLTLTLEPDMTFSNGNPVNAETVVATMNRTKSTPGIVQPKFALVKDITAPDDLTVEIAFTEYDPQFLYNLS